MTRSSSSSCPLILHVVVAGAEGVATPVHADQAPAALHRTRERPIDRTAGEGGRQQQQWRQWRCARRWRVDDEEAHVEGSRRQGGTDSRD